MKREYGQESEEEREGTIGVRRASVRVLVRGSGRQITPLKAATRFVFIMRG